MTSDKVIFDKGAKPIKWRKDNFFTYSPGMNEHMQEKGISVHTFYFFIKRLTEMWIIDIKVNTLKFLIEKIIYSKIDVEVVQAESMVTVIY